MMKRRWKGSQYYWVPKVNLQIVPGERILGGRALMRMVREAGGDHMRPVSAQE